MIARKAHPKHPDDPSRYVLVPLVYERQEGVWTPLLGPVGYHATELDAARAIHADWLRIWNQVQRLTRQIRALCEHPEFASFVGDGIDADTIGDSVQLLARIVEIADVNIQRLLDEPDSDDDIRIGGLLYRCDPKTNRLMRDRTLEESELAQSPDAVFLQAIYQAVRMARLTTGQPVTVRGFEHAIDTLILMLPESDDKTDERGAEQFIADHRFARSIMTAANRAFERTGQRVSIRGMREAIAVLQRAVLDRSDDEPESDDDVPTVRIKRPIDGAVVAKREPDREPLDLDESEPGENGSNGSGSSA